VFNRWPLFAASSTTGFFLPAVPAGLISRPLESLSAAGSVSKSQPAALSGDFEMDVHRLLNMIDLTQTVDSTLTGSLCIFSCNVIFLSFDVCRQ
jgi:hypothetical protein